MKLIFLDIDGVLNSTARFVVLGQKGATAEGLCPIAIGLVKFICEKTGAKVVISSTWRSLGHEKIAGMFEAKGWFNPPIIGKTPMISSGHRGTEINMYLNEMKDSGHTIEQYACIDDSSDFFVYQNLIRIDDTVGLTVRDCLEAIDVLGLKDKRDEKEINDLKKHTEREFKRKNEGPNKTF